MERLFEAENGIQVIALNDVQADAFLNNGLKEVTGRKPKEK